MSQQRLFKVRDRRQKGWFYLDNEYLNGYAKIFGAIGTAIYVSLCRHVDNETQECFPSMELIGEELSLSRNTITKYIKLFEKYKLISVDRVKDINGKWKNNVYFLLDKSEWVPHAQPLCTVNHAQLLTKPCTTADKNHAQLLCNKETHNNYTHRTRLPSKKLSGQSTDSIGKANNKYTPDFEEFWTMYPKKAGKIQSFAQWQKITTEDRKKIIEDIPKRHTDRKWIDGFIKDPERYLKYRQWEDNIENEVKGLKTYKI